VEHSGASAECHPWGSVQRRLGCSHSGAVQPWSAVNQDGTRRANRLLRFWRRARSEATEGEVL